MHAVIRFGVLRIQSNNVRKRKREGNTAVEKLLPCTTSQVLCSKWIDFLVCGDEQLIITNLQPIAY